MRIAWKAIAGKLGTDWLGIFASIVSLASLAVSARSCSVSQEAAREAHLQFNQDRQLVLTGVFDGEGREDCGEWAVKPIADGFQYQQGRAFLPPSIFKEPVYIEPSGRVRFMRGACQALKRYAAKRMTPKRFGFIAVAERDLPIILRSSYAVKGDAYDDEALYILHGIISVPHDGLEGVRVELNGLSFVQRRAPQDTIDLTVLDKLLDSTHSTVPVAKWVER